MMMHKALHPRYNIDRLYVTREERGRGLASFEVCVNGAIYGNEEYINKSKGRMVAAVLNNYKNRTRKKPLESQNGTKNNSDKLSVIN